MGRLGQIKRFPHTCVIYTMTNQTPFSEGEKSIIWSGICRKELMSTGQGRDYVIEADYRVQLGEMAKGKEVGAIVYGIKAGMTIAVEDKQGHHTLTVKEAYAGQLGTSVFADSGSYSSGESSSGNSTISPFD